MAWKEQLIVEARVAFVNDCAKGLFSMTELCEMHQSSRVTGYKWLQRAKAGESLADRSRAPQHCPHRTPAELEERIVQLRLKRPTWGPDKILAVLARQEPSQPWPSSTTAGEMLKRHHLVSPRRRTQRSSCAPRVRMEPQEPNEIWAADFKGEFRLGDQSYSYPLTVTDSYSRFLLGCDALGSTHHAPTKQVLQRLFAEFGLPQAIRSDNGTPFSSNAVAGLSRLNVWWIRLGIVPIRIQPGKPQQNGRHERMHRTLKQETTRPPGSNSADQQNRFDVFRQTFNFERPHAALEQKMPGEFYSPSPRPMPRKLPEPMYPGHFEVRRVCPSGAIKWRGHDCFITKTLSGELVGLEEVDDGVWSLCFCGLVLGRYHQPTRTWMPSNRPLCWLSPVVLRTPSESQHSENQHQSVNHVPDKNC